MSQQIRVPRRPGALRFLLVAVGVGVVAWYGYGLWTYPTFSNADIDRSASLNLVFDLSRQKDAVPLDAAERHRRLVAERKEVVADIQQEKDRLKTGLAIGFLLLGIGVFTFARKLLPKPPA